MRREAQIYREIFREGGVPAGNIMGNGRLTVEYPANGEASDWMLGAHNIIALSPELGTSASAAQSFFIKNMSEL